MVPTRWTSWGTPASVAARSGGDEAHVPGDWLEQDGGDLIRKSLKGVGDGRGVVEWAEDGLGGRAGGHAGAVRRAKRGGRRAGLDEQGIDVAVVVARHLN